MTKRVTTDDEAMTFHLVELETFIAVAQLGSFSLAARKLHVTQPSVTGRVQRLETALGVRLLRRTTRRVEPTSAGEELLEESLRTIAGLRKLATRFREGAHLAGHQVVVATTPTLAALFLAPVIRDYGRAVADVQVVLHDLPYDEALGSLEAETADLAILSYDGKDRRFRSELVGSEDLVVVAPRSHPLAALGRVTIAEMAGHRFLMLKQWASIRQQLSIALEASGLSMAPPTLVDHLSTLLGMLDAELGATLLPRSMVRRAVTSGHVSLEMADIALMRTFYVVTLRAAPARPPVEHFRRFLRRWVQSIQR